MLTTALKKIFGSKNERELNRLKPLVQAINALEEDSVIQEALGAHICDRFISAKRLEWEQYRVEVTPWELHKYLTSY